MNASTDFGIVDETSDYIVVDKPPFLLTHPTKPTKQPTLLNELRELLAFEIANAGQVSIINRLDRETSGLVLVAKTSAMARKLGLLMQKRLVTKEYLAIVWSWPDWETKLVDAPLDRQSKHRKSAIWLKQAIHQAGAPAQTEFVVQRRFLKEGGPSPYPLPEGEADSKAGREGNATFGGNRRDDESNGKKVTAVFSRDRFTIIRAVPLTGRTHQIRVHLSSLGHAIVGDKIYGPDEKLYLQFIEGGWTAELQQKLLLPRHELHSAKLAIDGVGDWSGPLPNDLA